MMARPPRINPAMYMLRASCAGVVNDVLKPHSFRPRGKRSRGGAKDAYCSPVGKTFMTYVAALRPSCDVTRITRRLSWLIGIPSRTDTTGGSIRPLTSTLAPPPLGMATTSASSACQMGPVTDR